MKYYDSLETRDPEERERSLMERLPRQVAHAKLHSPYFARLLAEVNPNDIHNRAALARLPVTRKSDLVHLQREQAPFGGINATPLSGLSRVYASAWAGPEPVLEPKTWPVKVDQQCVVVFVEHEGAYRLAEPG